MFAHHDTSGDLNAIPRHHISSFNDNEHKHTKSQRQHELDELETSKNRQCLKKTTKFLFSHIGLVGLVVIYSVAGAFLFQLLEIRQDKLNCQEYQGNLNVQIMALKQNIVNYIQYNATPATTNLEDNITVAYTKIGKMLTNYRSYVIESSAQYRSSGDNCSIVNKWTFANSLLFAITIVTTIGYGNITPVTWEGQLCCICYATIGIPIFLLCVANISGVLGEMFRFLYAKIICAPCTLVKKRRAKARKEKIEEETGISSDPSRPNVWKLDNEVNRKIPEKRLSNSLNHGEEMDQDELRRNQQIGVPLTVTMIIIAVYITIGSVIFHNFEEWTMIQSGYFCFITLATIGFGDFVPGQRKDDPHASAKLILGAVYVLFGMAILAMCFDLMQEEIVAKFRWIGTKIGVIDKHEEKPLDQTDKPSDSKVKARASINESMHTHRTILEDDRDTPTQSRISSGIRKASPRNKIARVHPMETNSTDEATLHQRATSKNLY